MLYVQKINRKKRVLSWGNPGIIATLHHSPTSRAQPHSTITATLRYSIRALGTAAKLSHIVCPYSQFVFIPCLSAFLQARPPSVFPPEPLLPTLFNPALVFLAPVPLRLISWFRPWSSLLRFLGSSTCLLRHPSSLQDLPAILSLIWPSAKLNPPDLGSDPARTQILHCYGFRGSSSCLPNLLSSCQAGLCLPHLCPIKPTNLLIVLHLGP